MKDTVITARIPARKKVRELRVLAACICLVAAANLAAILHYKASWLEVLSSLPIVLLLALLLYGVTVLARLLFSAAARIPAWFRPRRR
jgi:hypothetical protein